MSAAGTIHFNRTVWQCARCKRTHAPVDLALGVRAKGKWTSTVERKAAFAAAFSPFVDASLALRELAGLEVSSSEVDRIAREHGARIDSEQRRLEAEFLAPVDPLREPPAPKQTCERLVIQADAASVLTVAGEEHKSVYCGTVFPLEARGEKGGRPFLSERLYTASAVDMEDFSPRLKALAWRGGMRGAQTAFLADGARCLWKWAEEHLPPDTVLIQDFWHVCEHLSQLAQTLFPDDWSERFYKWKDWLRRSKMDLLLAELEELHAQRRGSARQALEAELGYLKAGRHRMDYARYEREGWLIGSGAIEGTCKRLVKARFGVTGARWLRANIPYILALRLAVFNNEWEACWQKTDAA